MLASVLAGRVQAAPRPPCHPPPPPFLLPGFQVCEQTAQLDMENLAGPQAGRELCPGLGEWVQRAGTQTRTLVLPPWGSYHPPPAA